MQRMAQVNKYGLKRSDLTREQKRQIRKNAGFGCVFCGKAIGQYEHIDPEFHEAETHDVSKMAFLCIGCHGKVTAKFISKQSVLNAAKNPAALKQGFSFEAFDVGTEHPVIHLGPLSASGCTYILRINDRPVFWIDSPTEAHEPFLMSACMRNTDGQLVFSIVENEWQANTENWDVEVIGPRITIRNGKGDIALSVRTDPPNQLYIEKMNMRMDGYLIRCDQGFFTIQTPQGRLLEAGEVDVANCHDAILIEGKNMKIAVGNSGKGPNSMSMRSMTLTRARPSAPRAGVRRTDPCPCESGRRYKHCCGTFPGWQPYDAD